jgi:MFS transporter, PAT family, beta-lactamase induction signal transducer AmpG
MSVAERVKPGRLDRMRVYFRPRTLTMLLLGFSSGLPFYLTGNTLGYWLRDEGTSLTAIGFLSWVGIAYSLKPLYAPVIDRSDVPLFGRLGRRRGWMLLTQLCVCLGLVAMSVIGPHGGLTLLGTCALIVAFSSSTQDIVVDAWRIEVADNADELGLLSSAYQLGYRVAIIVTESLILIAAGHLGWPISYGAMAVLMMVGIFATWKATEPRRADAVMSAKAAALPLWTARGFFDGFVGPFMVFFKTYGWTALLMLAMISLYRLPDFIRGPMQNPFYHDLGLSKDVVGGVRASVGMLSAFLGIAAGGLSSARFGYFRTLIAGAVVQALAISSFSILAFYGADIRTFSAIMAFDDFTLGFTGVALVTYMSSLTSLGYTATQYAILSSTYVYLGKILKGTSGAVVDYLSHHGHTLMGAYGLFFIGAGAIGVPGLILCIVLARVQKQRRGNSGSEGNSGTVIRGQ